MATQAQFQRLALAFDGVIAGEHMQHADFRANGRIFATLHPDSVRAMVKLTPVQQRARLQEFGTALEPASGAWGAQGCTMIELAAVDQGTLTALLTDAWQNVMAANSKHTNKK